jgi:hypothetical protein
MNPEEKLNLKKLLDNSDCENNTENIRKLKHSIRIRDDIRTLELLKRDERALMAMEPQAFLELCQNKALFLYTNYTDIFHKVLKDEIDLDIMSKLLQVLKLIEDGGVDQHEGSVMVGKVLKELYVDSALRRGENLDKLHAAEKVEPIVGKKITWKEYKQLDIAHTSNKSI